MTLEPITTHLTQADLVQLLDGEGEDLARARWQGHLDQCAQCRGEADGLRADSEAVTRWLRAADFEERRPGRSASAPDAAASKPRLGPAVGTWLKAAAVVLLVAAPAVAIPSVRGWVAERVGLGPETAPALTGMRAAAESAPSAIRFVPAPAEFTLVLTSPQASGTIFLGRTEGEEAILELTEPGQAEAVVSASSVRIENSPSATGDYALRLPRSVGSLRVDLGGRDLLVDGRGLDSGVVLPLTPR
jgi:hypothetical protein